MDLAQIDARLQEYTAAEHRIGANLHDLEAHAVYQLLQSGVLTGQTERAMQAMTTADPSLWELFSLLGQKLDQARAIRGTRSGIARNDLVSLQNLLDGPSVVVRRDSLPFAERDLTAEASNEQLITIAQLIDRMRVLYEPVRTAVAQADAALDGLLPRLSAADTTIATLRSACVELGTDQIDLDRLADTIAKVRELALTDPLAIAPDSRSTIDDALHQASARIANARASHNSLVADLARATDLVDRCRSLIQGAIADREHALQKVVVKSALPTVPSTAAIDGPRGIADALSRVENRGPWQQTRRQLDNWFERANRLESQLLRVANRVRAPLDRRAELRGRLRAFRAKMSGIGAGEDLTLHEMSDEIHNELYTAPSDLERAERLLTAFGDHLTHLNHLGQR